MPGFAVRGASRAWGFWAEDQLYDLVADPEERRNVYSWEASHRAGTVERALRGNLSAYLDKLGHPAGVFGEYVRPRHERPPYSRDAVDPKEATARLRRLLTQWTASKRAALGLGFDEVDALELAALAAAPRGPRGGGGGGGKGGGHKRSYGFGRHGP